MCKQEADLAKLCVATAVGSQKRLTKKLHSRMACRKKRKLIRSMNSVLASFHCAAQMSSVRYFHGPHEETAWILLTPYCARLCANEAVRASV